ncbi:MAG: tetratricopeptide repeat protein [Phycisphaerae bacterium]
MTAKRSDSSSKSSPNKLTRKKRHRKRNRSRKIAPNKHPGGSKKEQQRNKQGVPPKRVKGWRLWMFRVICLAVIPILFFLFLEIVLRIVGYGYPPTATIKCKVNGIDAYGDNVKFGWRFFPRKIAQEFDPFIFSADKPDDTYRIFILGASAAQGTPEAAFSFGRVLQTMLRSAYPKVTFEVIVTAMPAINSHVVVEITKDFAKHQPDLFIAYLGHNEVVGPYGAGTVFAPLSKSLSLIRIGIALKATRLGQLLTNLSESAGAKRNVPMVWRGMKMFLKKQVRVDDPGLETVYQHFQRNLEDISRIAGESGAKIILCTVGSSLKDCPPFASLHKPGLREEEKKKWDDIYKQGAEHESAGEFAEAIEHYLAAARIDDRYADLQFRLGRCYWAMGEYDRARDRYIEAREMDTLRFRADTRINEIIRAVSGNGAKEGVYLVDIVRALEENSPYKTPGEELLYEHVHLNFNGNYLLAKTVLKQVEEILPKWVKPREAHEPSLLTAAQCAQLLAYNDWARYNSIYKVLNYYIKEPPFTNQLYHSERLSRLEQRLADLEAGLTPETLKNAAAQYIRLLEKEPSDFWLRWRYAELLSVRFKNERAAAEQCRLTLKLLPHSYKPHLLLALSLGRLGLFNEAIEHLLRVIEIKPTSANAYHCLGLACQAQARIDEAIKYFYMAVRVQPNNSKAYKILGELLSQQGKIDQAVEISRKGLLFIPDDLYLHHNLGVFLNMQGHKDEAVKELQTALRIDPNSAQTRKVLNAIKKPNKSISDTNR